MKKNKIVLKCLTVILILIFFVACSDKKNTELKKVDFLLDWVPNTNHTGLFVAKDKGYFEEIGIDLDIKQPAEESTSGLVINNKAPFGIYFQDYLAGKLSKNAPITAVAAIIDDNTLGIISAKDLNIFRPKDMENHSYGTWNDPLELEMLNLILKKDGGNFEKVKKIPNTDSNSIVNIGNKLFDTAAVYYAWDKIMADNLKIETNFFYFKDFAEELNFYSPIIIANNDYLKDNKEEARKIIQAIKKGYQYSMEHPEEAAAILIKYAPELENKKDFVIESQKYLSERYAKNKENWGHIDSKRWSNFYKWVNENNILKNQIGINSGFDNQYVD